MRAFLINLDRSPERLAHMLGEAARARITLERVSAIDSRNLSEADLRQCSENPRDTARRLVPGDVAAFLSHRALWHQIAESNDPYTAIFEDDIRVGTGLAALLDDPSWIPADADLVKVETNLAPTVIDRDATAMVGARRVHRLRGWHSGMAGYVITPNAAAQLVAKSRIIRAPVDIFVYGATSDTPSLKIYQLVPGICVQAQFETDGDPALESLVAGPRRAAQPRRNFAQKIVREAYRPFERATRAITRRATNAFGNTLTAPVPFM